MSSGQPPPMDDLPLFRQTDPADPEAATPAPEAEAAPPESREPSAVTPPEPVEGPATLTNRLGAALLDLAVLAAAAVTLPAGALLLGVAVTMETWPAFLAPWLAFSFLYHVVPLAFWGRTPGMASMELKARNVDDGALSFGQAVVRWLATLGTLALLGLPGLLALTGRSAIDRASGTVTLWRGVPSG